MTADVLAPLAHRTARPEKSGGYAALLAEVRSARLLERSTAAYLPRALTLAGMLGGGIFAFVRLGSSWWQLLVAGYLAVVFAQIGFFGHDAGHQQISWHKKRNDAIGMFTSNLLIGVSYGWWVGKHSRHHRHPNEVGSDPDIERSLLAWTPAQAAQQRGAIRFIANRQAVFFIPLLMLEGLNLRWSSIQWCRGNRSGRAREIVLLCAHVAGWTALLLSVLPPIQALAFFTVQQALFGLYLGSTFAPNHKGMLIVEPGHALDFLRRQVLTSRNVRGGRAVATIFGGLNYQIEHHLFPSMPSRNLRRCQPMVKRFCAAHGVTYCETNVFASYRRVLVYLHALRPDFP